MKSGYYPKLKVTDGLISYVNAIKEVFPDSRHQLSIFHIIKNGFKHISQSVTEIKLMNNLKKRMSKFFRSKDKRII